jgi:hypothetical protein
MVYFNETAHTPDPIAAVAAGFLVCDPVTTIPAFVVGLPYSYNTPLAGATVTMGTAERRCVIDPAGLLATLTVVLPPSPSDGQVAGVSSTQAITALTVNAGTGGAAIVGVPAALTAGQAFTVLYRSTGNSWYLSA